jgi:hypothetical protein
MITATLSGENGFMVLLIYELFFVGGAYNYSGS